MKPHAPASPFEIDIRLRTLDELFNSLDPSPLVDRDIDDAIEDFIVDSVPEAPRGAPISLVLHLPSGHLSGIDAAALEQSITNYFSFLEARQTRQLSDCLAGQAVCHGCLSRMIALRMVRSFLATAMRATFFGFPRAMRSSRNALRIGL